jgi:ribose/xylose/arabinose/galactoside ABC-type transport system permease subunit
MSDLARILIFLGLLLVVAGLIVLGLNRLNIPLGRLPGDFNWRGKGWSVSFPLVTCLLLSAILSFVLWMVSHFRR